MLLLAACEPAEPTAAQAAEKLQAQINELLEEVDKSLEEVGDLDLAGLCANSGKITAGMDLLVPRYRDFAVLMEELGDMQQALIAGGAANQFAVDAQEIRRNCSTRGAAAATQTESSANQLTEKKAPDVEDLSTPTTAEENTSEQSAASDSTSPNTSISGGDGGSGVSATRARSHLSKGEGLGTSDWLAQPGNGTHTG